MAQFWPPTPDDTGWVVVAGAGRYRRLGGSVSIILNKSTSAGSGTFFTLPVGSRPPESFDFLLRAGGGPTFVAVGAVSTSGAVTWAGHSGTTLAGFVVFAI